MKLHKLILNAKLKKLEKQNVLVFHGNLTAIEWRRVKNLCRDFTPNVENGLQFFFLSKSISPRISSGKLKVSLDDGKNAPFGNPISVNHKIVKHVEDRSKENTEARIKLAGCLLSFAPETSKNLLVNVQGAKQFHATDLLKELESPEFRSNLLLLYGQLSSVPLNHLDLKKALQLDSQETYQQLLFSIQLCYVSLNSVFYQNINELISPLHDLKRYPATCSTTEN